MGMDEFSESHTRHMILNTIRRLRTKFKKDYGEVVIACDDRHNWRKDVYPYYKANRKKMRENSAIDWDTMHEQLTLIRTELMEYFPYKVIMVDKAEADDIIGAIANQLGTFLNTGEPIMICSADKDFVQLQKYGNVKQYNPILDKYVRINDPVGYLVEHIIKGDRGDGVPNMLSKDDVFINGRQTPCRQKFIDATLLDNKGKELQDYTWKDPELKRGFERNRLLIDLENIPTVIKLAVAHALKQPDKTRGKLFNYFTKNRLKNLINKLDEF
tara:strand:- start:10349 stop:11161 length:813 start_codon:yes stop_codon:yes gene_type:complete